MSDAVRSLPIWRLDCRTKSFVLGLCLSADDLEALVDWESGPPCCTHASPGVWRRNVLHAACRSDGAIARRVGDLLDLRHADAVLHVRSSERDVLAGEVRAHVLAGRRAAFAPTLWALATDARDEVRALAAIVVSEAFVLGCALVRENDT